MQKKKIAFFIPPNFDSDLIIRTGNNCARFQRKKRRGDSADVIKDGNVVRFNWRGFVKPERGEDGEEVAYAVSTTEFSCRGQRARSEK